MGANSKQLDWAAEGLARERGLQADALFARGAALGGMLATVAHFPRALVAGGETGGDAGCWFLVAGC